MSHPFVLIFLILIGVVVPSQNSPLFIDDFSLENYVDPNFYRNFNSFSKEYGQNFDKYIEEKFHDAGIGDHSFIDVNTSVNTAPDLPYNDSDENQTESYNEESGSEEANKSTNEVYDEFSHPSASEIKDMDMVTNYSNQNQTEIEGEKWADQSTEAKDELTHSTVNEIKDTRLEKWLKDIAENFSDQNQTEIEDEKWADQSTEANDELIHSTVNEIEDTRLEKWLKDIAKNFSDQNQTEIADEMWTVQSTKANDELTHPTASKVEDVFLEKWLNNFIANHADQKETKDIAASTEYSDLITPEENIPNKLESIETNKKMETNHGIVSENDFNWLDEIFRNPKTDQINDSNKEITSKNIEQDKTGRHLIDSTVSYTSAGTSRNNTDNTQDSIQNYNKVYTHENDFVLPTIEISISFESSRKITDSLKAKEELYQPNNYYDIQIVPNPVAFLKPTNNEAWNKQYPFKPLFNTYNNIPLNMNPLNNIWQSVPERQPILTSIPMGPFPLIFPYHVYGAPAPMYVPYPYNAL